MTRVGSRKLKNRWGTYLKRVKAGEQVLVTERGKPVARIIPESAHAELSEDEVLDRLAATGSLTRGRGRLRPFKPVPAKGKPASRIIIEERR